MYPRPTLVSSAVVAASLCVAASAAAQPFAYVVGARSGALNRGVQVLTVIDIPSRAKIVSVPLGEGCLCLFENAAISSDASQIYVSNFWSNTVSVFDTATNEVLRTLNVQPAPGSLAVSPDGTRLYVNTVTPTTGYAVQVLDIASGSTTATIPLEVPQSGSGMAISPDGTRLYVTNQALNGSTVTVIDTTIDAVIATIPTPTVPRGIDVTPDGQFVYVAVQQANAVAAISTASNAVVTSIPAGTAPDNVRVLPNGTRVYAVTDDQLTVIRTDTHSVSGVIPAFLPRAIDFTPDSSTGVVTADERVYLLDVASGGLVATIPFATETEGNPNYLVVPQSVPPPPDAPTDLVAKSVDGNTVTLEWQPASAGSAASMYVLEGGVTPGQTLASVRAARPSPTMTVSAPSGAFYVRLHAVGVGGRSPASNEIRIFVNTPAAPSAPASLLGLVNGDSVALAWRSTFEGGEPTALALDVSGSLDLTLPLPLTESFSFTGVPPGTYTLSLRARNAAGVFGPPSNELTLAFPGACSGVPQAPANFVAYREGRTVFVRWDPPDTGVAPSGYVLNVTGPLVGSVPTTARFLSGAVPPGTYVLSVAARNACGTGTSTASRVLEVP